MPRPEPADHFRWRRRVGIRDSRGPRRRLASSLAAASFTLVNELANVSVDEWRSGRGPRRRLAFTDSS
jgi:hypothetical protein